MGLKEAFEKEAFRLEEGADNFNESARLYEEAGITGAACKTLIDSERRKNTQASNDVRARQLVRF